jgi:hypothetical protein
MNIKISSGSPGIRVKKIPIVSDRDFFFENYYCLTNFVLTVPSALSRVIK